MPPVGMELPIPAIEGSQSWLCYLIKLEHTVKHVLRIHNWTFCLVVEFLSFRRGKNMHY